MTVRAAFHYLDGHQEYRDLQDYEVKPTIVFAKPLPVPMRITAYFDESTPLEIPVHRFECIGGRECLLYVERDSR